MKYTVLSIMFSIAFVFSIIAMLLQKSFANHIGFDEVCIAGTSLYLAVKAFLREDVNEE